MKALRGFIRLFFSMAAFFLTLIFVLRILAPGNSETAYFFHWIQPTQSLLEALYAWLIAPIQNAWEWIAPFVPSWLKAWFPLIPASSMANALVQSILKIPGLADTFFGWNLSNLPLENWLPGVVDWRILMAIGFWGWVESLLMQFCIRIEALLYRQYLRRQDAALVRSFREQVSQGPNTLL